MAHGHSVVDSDKYFTIDPVTREVANKSGKLVLIQHDHNSERITLALPKEIDGHDMTLCNSVKIHYINVEFAERELEEGGTVYEPTGKEYKGVYETDDIGVDPANADNVICSWLVSRNATQYVGKLNFVARFSCIADDGTEEYGWSSDIYEGIVITEGIYNSDVIVEEYADVLEKWRQELVLANVVEQYTPEEARAELGAAAKFTANATITTAWTVDTAPYSQTVNVAGIMATDDLHIYPVYSNDVETGIAQREAWSMVYRAEPKDGAIYFECYEEAPAVEIPVRIEVIR